MYVVRNVILLIYNVSAFSWTGSELYGKHILAYLCMGFFYILIDTFLGFDSCTACLIYCSLALCHEVQVSA